MPSQPRTFSRPSAAFAAAVVGVGALAVGTAFALTEPTPPAKPGEAPAPEVKVEHAPVDRARTPAGSFAPIVQKVAPSVVEIFVTSKTGGQQGAAPQEGSDLFERFFGQQRRRNAPGGNNEDSFAPRQSGLGSGVIVSTEGYILTNRHVVGDAKDAREIRVALSDGREFSAKLVGADEKTDVAVVKIKADNIQALTFADSNELAVGDIVLAVGNPFGITQSVTQGIVSGKDRQTGNATDEDFIQTDAAINPGNSGGALVDVEGRLVGINTAILSRSGGNQGIGFAIPSNLCQWVMTSLVKTGHVERGYLGVAIQSLTPTLAQQFGLEKITGALVADVTAGGPAEKAGIRSGDVIRTYNGQNVRDSAQFKLQVAETAPGTKVNVQLVRERENKDLEVTVNTQPGQTLAKGNRPDTSGDKGHEALQGVAVVELDPNARRQLSAPESLRGAVISEVQPNSAAADAGLKQGDVILEINHKPVKNAQDAVDLTAKPTTNQTLVKVWTRNGVRYLTVEEDNVE